jgi:hypothetical protein
MYIDICNNFLKTFLSQKHIIFFCSNLVLDSDLDSPKSLDPNNINMDPASNTWEMQLLASPPTGSLQPGWTWWQCRAGPARAHTCTTGSRDMAAILNLQSNQSVFKSGKSINKCREFLRANSGLKYIDQLRLALLIQLALAAAALYMRGIFIQNNQLKNVFP